MDSVTNAKINLNFTDQYARMFKGKRVKQVTLIVTHNCNMRCTYCYEHNKSKEKMSFETAKRCVDMLFKCDEENHPYINPEVADGIVLDFIGGEPLLEIELIDAVMDYFLSEALRRNHRWKVNYMISLTTNGLLVKTEAVQRFMYKCNGRLSINVTLDGDRKTHDSCRYDCDGCGTYDRAAEAMELVMNRYGHNGTKFTVAPGNVDRVFIASKDMIEKYDLRSFHCNCVYEEGWEPHHATTFNHELKKLADWVIDSSRYKNMVLTIFDPQIGKPIPDIDNHNWCGGTGLMMAFDIDGTILPCLRYSSIALGQNREPYVIGDLENGIGIREEHKARIATLDAITRTSQSSDKCLSCPIASGCGWCSAYNYEVTGTPDKRVTYICQMHQARVMATSYYWNRIYEREGVDKRFQLDIPKDWAMEIIDEKEWDGLVNM